MFDEPWTYERNAERGAVTVEAAIAVCSLAVVFGLVLAGVAAVVDQMRCTDAATQAARVLARGAGVPTAEDVVEASAPAGATLTVRRDGDAVVARVSVRPVGGLLPGVVVRAEARAELEPGMDEEVAGEVDGPP
ncbi:TadE family type IV pilus minor pilin [Saccharomonospora xinjiangensis]|uniref:TadE family type IV pilus minor pilin n=1 Tax=Saccharomonospora xinjiangensis TaxID=75294 RepID=UPI00350FDC32